MPPPARRDRRIYAYVCRYNNGNAPNLWRGNFTLAACKGPIRKHARPGDVVIGFQQKDGLAPLFAFRVEERLEWPAYVRRCEDSLRGKLRSAAHPVGDCYLTAQGELRNGRDPFHASPKNIKQDWENGVLLSRNYVDWSRGCWTCGGKQLPQADWLPDLVREWAQRLKDPRSGWIGYRIVRAPHFANSPHLIHKWAAKHLVHSIDTL